MTACSTAIDRVFLFKYKNKVYTSMTDFAKANTEFPNYSGHRNMDVENFVIPKPHFNQSKERQVFCKLHQGKTFSELGLTVIPLGKYIFNEKDFE